MGGAVYQALLVGRGLVFTVCVRVLVLEAAWLALGLSIAEQIAVDAVSTRKEAKTVAAHTHAYTRTQGLPHHRCEEGVVGRRGRSDRLHGIYDLTVTWHDLAYY